MDIRKTIVQNMSIIDKITALDAYTRSKWIVRCFPIMSSGKGTLFPMVKWWTLDFCIIRFFKCRIFK